MASGDCENEDDLFAHPDEPEYYYHCSHGVAYLKKCSGILHFNPILQICDWPEHAGNPAAWRNPGAERS
ncbi:carbohydrate-binding module family 14 protein [Streptomyces sp. NPDC003042]